MILLVCRDLEQVNKAKSIWDDTDRFKAITIGSSLMGHRFERAIFLFDPYVEKLQTSWTGQQLVDEIQIKLAPKAKVEFL